MDKEFWIALANNEYNLPDGHTLAELTGILFGYLGNVDSELRDDIAYMTYANWLKQKRYTAEEVRAHISTLLANLEHGIGDTETDSVFLRAFSVLMLAELVHNDNKSPLLEKEQISEILAKGLWYLAAEKDPRGHIPIKGWAHALAHTADLLLVLGKNRNIEKADHEHILQSIATKLIHSTNWIYFHGEDDRLANATTAILQRNLISLEFVEAWLKSITEPGKPWSGAYVDADQAKAFHNSRNYLRSLSHLIEATEQWQASLDTAHLVHDALDNLKPY
jgi:hypothetical protein